MTVHRESSAVDEMDRCAWITEFHASLRIQAFCFFSLQHGTDDNAGSGLNLTPP